MFKENRTFIICELSQTHEGDISIAKELINAAARAQADAVKLQVFRADELAVGRYKHYGLFKKLQWPKETWKDLIRYTHKAGLYFFADIFGVESLAMLQRAEADVVKIHATDMRNDKLLQACAQCELPVILSIGGADIKETKNAVKLLKQGQNNKEIVLMHGFQSYPTLIEHTNLEKMRYFKDQFKLRVGFADHIDGDHPQNSSLCALAIGMGACVIEKHITKDRALKMEDYESALNPEDFVRFVQRIRELDAAKSCYSDALSPVETQYRKATRKHVVSLKEIKKGSAITQNDIAFKRAPSQAEPLDFADVLGKKALKDFKIDEVITSENIALIE